MVGALGVDQAKLFTSVFFVGAVLAGLGGALQIPREPANLELDLAVIADAFVVTVVGGLGSLGGAFLAAILIGVAKAFCIGLGVLQAHPGGRVRDHGRGAGAAALRPARQAAGRCRAPPATRRRRCSRRAAGRSRCAGSRCFLLVPLLADRYVTVLLTDIVCFALFAVSLHFIMGPAGMVSFGHAAYFGLGAYAGGAAVQAAPACRWSWRWCWRRSSPALFAVVYGWFCVRLSGVYLAMLTLAFAQISWSIVFQWDALTSAATAWSASGRRRGSPARPPTTT